MNRIEIFKKELELIKNKDIKNFVEVCLNEVPDYFFYVAASSTGKYHPAYALGEGGLVRHTKAATRIAYELFRTDLYNYNSDQQDLILASLILHDTRKHGNNGSKWTVVEHPLLAAQAIRNSNGTLNQEYKEIIAQNIETHMGKWTQDYKTGKEVLQKPKTGMQKFVHQCDYLASRKCLEFNFEAELSK
jgi:23S rRNA maturation-related 3'-5' exoribonuclease YhaM